MIGCGGEIRIRGMSYEMELIFKGGRLCEEKLVLSEF
jgi:hypothetical protein